VNAAVTPYFKILNYMTRVKGGKASRKRHKKILNRAAGFRGAGSVLFKTANQQVMKALRYSYRGRREKKRQYRGLWIARINAAVRRYGTSYSDFMHHLKDQSVGLNRKMMAQLCVCDPDAFMQLLLF
jgi:large subunit ribosomal protein L20